MQRYEPGGPKSSFSWYKKATNGSSFYTIEKHFFGVRTCNGWLEIASRKEQLI
ncbi:hypothetical protein FLBR109950_15995 [Flavobacterium branchiophilum]